MPDQVVSMTQYQQVQREVRQLKLEKKLRQGGQVTYQQKMISERIKKKLSYKDQENALKNLHER